MVKLNPEVTITDRRAAARGPLQASVAPTGVTHEGGDGYQRDAQSELYLRATTMFYGENAFYESGNQSASRLRELTRELATTSWGWLQDFLPWLRNEGNVRTAAIVMALEAVHARLNYVGTVPGVGQVPMPMRGHGNRELVRRVLVRADEPAEALAYWLATYGKRIPKPVKRGIADAASRLYNERNFLRYDSPVRGVRMGDVLELCHVRGTATRRVIQSAMRVDPFIKTEPVVLAVVDSLASSWQDDLFRWMITARHNREGAEPSATLPAVSARWKLNHLPAYQRHLIARSNGDVSLDGLSGNVKEILELATAGQWEWLQSWLGEEPRGDEAAVTVSKLDRWRLVLPQLGYMALLRNLRNLDEVQLPDADARPLIARIADPEQVKRSRQLPLRFLSAYLNAPSLRWGHALEQALDHSLVNVPELTGRTLVLIDTSGSMTWATLSGNSKVNLVKGAALFGLALARKNPNATDVYGFADGQFYVDNVRQGSSLLRIVDLFCQQVGKVGGGTRIAEAVRNTFQRDRHDRVVIFTDMQTFAHGNPSYRYGPGDVAGAIPADVPAYGFNLAGYPNTAMAGVGKGNRHELGGLTDHTFSLIQQLEAGHDGTWPWEKR